MAIINNNYQLFVSSYILIAFALYCSDIVYYEKYKDKKITKMSLVEVNALYRSLRSVLTDAIKAGGTTIQDYRNTDGDKGEYAGQLSIYGREGKPCYGCNSEVQRVVFSNRSAFYCPSCQPFRRNK